MSGCQHFQNHKAPTPLGRGRWNWAHIFYGSKDKTTRKRNSEFGISTPCAAWGHSELSSVGRDDPPLAGCLLFCSFTCCNIFHSPTSTHYHVVPTQGSAKITKTSYRRENQSISSTAGHNPTGQEDGLRDPDRRLLTCRSAHSHLLFWLMMTSQPVAKTTMIRVTWPRDTRWLAAGSSAPQQTDQVTARAGTVISTISISLTLTSLAKRVSRRRYDS